MKGSIKYTCEFCGKEFYGPPSRSKAKHITCSKECFGKLAKSRSDLNCTCPIYGKKFHSKPSHIKRFKEVCCSKECNNIRRRNVMLGENNHQFGLKGSNNPTWKSDEKINRSGYRMIRALDHPFKNCDGFVLEHRLVAEKYLLTDENSVIINGKKYLDPNFEVHHIDENRLNNSPSNLLILTHEQHRQYHNKFMWRELLTGHIAKKEYNMDKVPILVKRADVEAKLPTKAHEGDAGWDLYSLYDYTINPHETVKVDTGLNFQLPEGTFGAIYARSGLSTKQGLRPANCVGVCDSGYRNNYIVPLYNDSDEVRTIHKHDRIAQLIIQPFIQTELTEVNTLDETERGSGGFGSTGV